jgi:ATP-binding cassette subfamily B protein
MGNLLSLLRYAWPHWRPLAAAVVMMLLSILTVLVRPWPFKIMIDNVLGDQPLSPAADRFFRAVAGDYDRSDLLGWVCAAAVLVVVVGILVEMGKALANVTFGQRVTYDLGADLFLHVQRQSVLFHARRPVGDTTSRIVEDSYCVQQFVIKAVLPLVQAIVTVVATFFILWHVSPSLTLVSLGALPFLGLSLWLFSPPLKVRNRARRDLEGSMMTTVQETLSAIPAVQAFSREEREQAKFRRQADSTVTAYRRTTFAEMWFQLTVGLVLAIATAALMFVGGRLALDGTVTTGTIVLFLLYLAAFYAPLQTLSTTVSALQLAAAQADRITELFDALPDVRDEPGARSLRLQGPIRYEDVCFGYEPDVPVLHEISLEARPGDVVAIVGPTGAGKTTLVSLLMRFFDPWSGRVTVDGEDIRHLSLRSLRGQVATVLQDPFIFPVTISENIAYGLPDAAKEDIVAAAVAANADEFIRRLPDGYETVVGERGITLSGGEKQRLSIARAFLKDAPILILDEPTSALDAHTEARLLLALKRLMRQRTTFIIAHRLSTIRNADRILVVNQGEIVEQGRHAELVTANGLYASLYRQQMDFTRHESALSEDDTVAGATP